MTSSRLKYFSAISAVANSGRMFSISAPISADRQKAKSPRSAVLERLNRTDDRAPVCRGRYSGSESTAAVRRRNGQAKGEAASCRSENGGGRAQKNSCRRVATHRRSTWPAPILARVRQDPNWPKRHGRRLRSRKAADARIAKASALKHPARPERFRDRG